MKTGEFFDKLKDGGGFGSKSRVLVIRNRVEQKELRELLDSRSANYGWVRLSRCVAAGAFVPPAAAVFATLKEAVSQENENGRMAYVTGLSAMLAIWNSSERVSAFEQLRTLMDDPGSRVLVFLRSYPDEAQGIFSHPRYIEGNTILVVGEKSDDEPPVEIRFVSSGMAKHMIEGSSCGSLRSFLSDFEVGVFPSGGVNIAFEPYDAKIAGVGGAVRQIFRHGDYLRMFCGYSGGLPSRAETWLFEKMTDAGKQGMSACDFAKTLFFQGDLSSVCRDAPRMVAGCSEEEKEVLLWTLRNSLSRDSYLYKVISHGQFDGSNFKSCYVCTALTLIGDVNEKALSCERREGIASILLDDKFSLDAEMADFIERSREMDVYRIIPWLNNRTRLERQAAIYLLRKVENLKLLPENFIDAFPLLEGYLAPYALGSVDLNEYFTEYRRLKIANVVTAEFCETAKSVCYPVKGIRSRDDVLADVANADAQIIMVDAMGAEYLPLIVHLATRLHYDIAEAYPVSVKIPTSTRFNASDKIRSRSVTCISDLDNIIHNGVHKNSSSTDEENFVGMLEVFSEMVMPAVAKAMAKNGRVVLTADHGASRLAVLANRQRLNNTLSIKGVDGDAEDWRYLKSDPNALPPPSVASNLQGDYWVVKGYDRFSKSGGKLNELHGGLTYEEVLVPFVVFERGAVFSPVETQVGTVEQLVENSDFDL